MTTLERTQRDRVLAIAASWIGTPFHDHAEVKGAGADCATFLKCVFVEAGLVAPFAIGPYSPQFFLHQAEERYLGWVMKFAREIEREALQGADVVLYKIGKCFAHGALVIEPGWPAILHAHHASRAVRRGDGRNPHLGTPVIETKFFSLWRE